MSRKITIAGGGLAGLTLGIALRKRGLEVRLCEAGHYPRHRVCGEFILGLQEAEIETLGLTEIFSTLRRERQASWIIDGHIAATHQLPAAAYIVSRYSLDQRLAEVFQESGGQLETSTRIDRSQQHEGMIWCGGRAQQASSWAGLKAHVLGLTPLSSSGLEMHLGHGGYAGVVEVEADRWNVCCLLPATILRQAAQSVAKLDLLPQALSLLGLHHLAEQIRAANVDSASVVGVSHLQLGWQEPPPTGMVVIGDQRAVIPPFTGAGMTMAFVAAALAIDPIEQWVRGKLSWSEVALVIEKRFRNRFSRPLRWASLLHPLTTQRWIQQALRPVLPWLPLRFLASRLR